jgi:hypothetical protein
MGRHSIGSRAMTPAEGQRRYMARLRQRAAVTAAPRPAEPKDRRATIADDDHDRTAT